MEKVNPSKENLARIATAAGEDLADIADEIARGISQLWLIGDAHMVTRVETHNNKRELVIVCLEGQGSQAIADEVYRIAQLNQISSIRFHTQTRGFERILRKFAPVEVERVYKVQVNYGE